VLLFRLLIRWRCRNEGHKAPGLDGRQIGRIRSSCCNWKRCETKAIVSCLQVPKCLKCGTSFGLFTRRHHCRLCAKIFCSKCSAFAQVTPSLPIRSLPECPSDPSRNSLGFAGFQHDAAFKVSAWPTCPVPCVRLNHRRAREHTECATIALAWKVSRLCRTRSSSLARNWKLPPSSRTATSRIFPPGSRHSLALLMFSSFAGNSRDRHSRSISLIGECWGPGGEEWSAGLLRDTL